MLKHNTWYKITIPEETRQGLLFKEVIRVVKYLDKEKVHDRLNVYQTELSFSENFHVFEDELGILQVIKIKDNYKVEER